MYLTSIGSSNDETADDKTHHHHHHQQQNINYETQYITDQLSLFNLSTNPVYNWSRSSWVNEARRLESSSSNQLDKKDNKLKSNHFVLKNAKLLTEKSSFPRDFDKEKRLNLGGGGMPRSKRRAPSNTNHHHQASTDMSPSAHEDGMPRHPSKRLRHNTSSARRYGKTDDLSSASAFSQKRCTAWFREYTGPDDPDTLGPEGMEKFCEDIAVEPENVVMLVLAYRMNARQMGFFTLSEWTKGLTELQCDTINKLQQKLEYLRNLLNDSHTFKGIYRYAYDFARDKDQRSMDMETARVMLQLLLGKNWPLFSQFAQFLDQSKYKVINKDQWYNILEFSRTINHDLSNYDLDGAWPVMLDEFVEWLKIQRGEEISSTLNRGS